MVNSTAPTPLNAIPVKQVNAAPDGHELTSPTFALSIPEAGQIVPLCFAVPEGVTLAAPARHVLSWQPQGAEVLGQIKWLLNQKGLHLPTRSLAHQAERSIPGLQRLDAHMGTARGDQTGELA